MQLLGFTFDQEKNEQNTKDLKDTATQDSNQEPVQDHSKDTSNTFGQNEDYNIFNFSTETDIQDEQIDTDKENATTNIEQSTPIDTELQTDNLVLAMINEDIEQDRETEVEYRGSGPKNNNLEKEKEYIEALNHIKLEKTYTVPEYNYEKVEQFILNTSSDTTREMGTFLNEFTQVNAINYMKEEYVKSNKNKIEINLAYIKFGYIGYKISEEYGGYEYSETLKMEYVAVVTAIVRGIYNAYTNTLKYTSTSDNEKRYIFEDTDYEIIYNTHAEDIENFLFLNIDFSYNRLTTLLNTSKLNTSKLFIEYLLYLNKIYNTLDINKIIYKKESHNSIGFLNAKTFNAILDAYSKLGNIPQNKYKSKDRKEPSIDYILDKVNRTQDTIFSGNIPIEKKFSGTLSDYYTVTVLPFMPAYKSYKTYIDYQIYYDLRSMVDTKEEYTVFAESITTDRKKGYKPISALDRVKKSTELIRYNTITNGNLAYIVKPLTNDIVDNRTLEYSYPKMLRVDLQNEVTKEDKIKLDNTNLIRLAVLESMF